MPRRATGGPNLRFERDLVENVAGPLDAVVFLQTIEHIEDVPALLAAIGAAAPLAFISTPNRLTLAPEGAEKSDNPWHLREYTIEEYRELLEPAFAEVEIRGLFHAGKLAIHERAIGLGWDRVHWLLRLTKPFYDRFTPAISASDFVPEARVRGGSQQGAGLRGRLPRDDPRPDGAGTGVSGEAGSRTASATSRSSSTPTCPTSRGSAPIRSARSGSSTRSSAPTCRSSRRARDLTMTVTPVLADQLEDAGAGERLMEFVREYRIGSAELDARDVEPELVPACEAEAGRYRDAL